MGADLVEEVTVVGYNDNRVVKVDKEVFQPRDRLDIQTVGWLVQKQDIWFTKEGLGQEDLDLLTVGQFAHVLVMQVLRNVEVLE